MWLASQWTLRAGHEWRGGEDRFYRELLDGSRAANRLGWQRTVGTATGRPYGFSRMQVRKRAPALCRECALRDACPIEDFPHVRPGRPVDDPPPALGADPDPEGTAGPAAQVVEGEPQAVWLTAESLGDEDPALAARPGLPAVFVFDEPFLRRLRFSAKRLVFLTRRCGPSPSIRGPGSRARTPAPPSPTPRGGAACACAERRPPDPISPLPCAVPAGPSEGCRSG